MQSRGELRGTPVVMLSERLNTVEDPQLGEAEAALVAEMAQVFGG